VIVTAAIGIVGFTHTSHASAATLTPTNCHDGGAGSLRNTIHLALSGDTVDLRPLSCTRIVLAGGILISQDDLTIVGRGASVQTIDGNHVTRIFAHNGHGTLLIRALAMANGADTNRPERLTAGGGCVRSSGSVELQRAWVHHCLTNTNGGGIYAEGNVRLSRSRVFANQAGGTGGGIVGNADVSLSFSDVASNVVRAGPATNAFAMGGGVLAGRRLTMFRSRLIGNEVLSTGNALVGAASAGESIVVSYSVIANNSAQVWPGIRLIYGSVILRNSTVANNHGQYGAAVETSQNTGDPESVVYNSTITGNSGGANSAVHVDGTLWIANSTIAFNRGSGLHWDGDPLPGACEGAVFAYDILFSYSNIIALNACDSGANQDVYAGLIDGSNNLIGSSLNPLPPDTISADPMLAPLADNGGPTRTHALLDGSPAIEQGNNVMNLALDQRGPGFPRVKGARADIGAFER